jgi:hypothetical protein
MAEQEDDEQEFARQLRTAMDAISEAISRLLQAGEVDPRVIALAVAGVAGELGASMALAGEDDFETILGDLADVLRHTGREHGEALAVALAPVAGSA